MLRRFVVTFAVVMNLLLVDQVVKAAAVVSLKGQPARIAQRLDGMFLDGLAAEVAALRRAYPVWSDTASAAIGYKEFIDGLPPAAVREKILVRTRQLAKRQDTWFRHQATPLYVPIGATAEETAANVRRIWRAHGPWSVRLEPEGA